MSVSTRIGLVAPLPPQVGGVASVAEWLLGHEKELGCSYSTFNLQRPLAEKRGGRLRLHALPRQLRQLGRFIRWIRRSPTVVHYCVSCSRTGLPRDALYIALLRLNGRRTIAHVHGAYLDFAAKSRWRSPLLRLIGHCTSERVALSPASVEILASIGISSRYILNPLRFEPGEAPPAHGDAGPFRLLFVGAYGRRKGCPELVEALARVRGQGLDARLTIVGKEERKGDDAVVTDKVRAHGLDGAVEFTGVKTASEMPPAYRGADVICLPSRHEGLPMALLEAMAFGLPAVATPVGGIADLVIHGDTGLLVSPGDVDGLAHAIATLAGDTERRRRMGARGRERVFALAGPTTIASEWRELYAALAKTTSASGRQNQP
jgi:glycosyltransferase involved in cell wall biosynthesis